MNILVTMNRFVIVLLSILFVSCSDSNSKAASESGSNNANSSGLRDTAFFSEIRALPYLQQKVRMDYHFSITLQKAVRQVSSCWIILNQKD
jgi:hypothetical protein